LVKKTTGKHLLIEFSQSADELNSIALIAFTKLHFEVVMQNDK